MGEIAQMLFEHRFYDNPKDLEINGYTRKNNEENGEHYEIGNDKLLSKCEKLISEGKEKEAVNLINKEVDLSFIHTFEQDKLKREQEAYKLKERQEKEGKTKASESKKDFLSDMGVS